MDRKGYFAFIKEISAIMDSIVTHFSVEDVRLLSENIVMILETVKNLTQPKMLHALNNALTVYQNIDIESIEEYSAMRALRELRTPEMKRGLGFIITFLKNVSREQTNLQPAC